MGAITYKCPACGGELVFDPKSGQYRCPYCGSLYTQQQMDELNPSEGSTRQEDDYAPGEDSSAAYSEAERSASQGAKKQKKNKKDPESAVVYSCPSCGAEIVTSETTAATFCYYCHNPVVLKGRVSGEYLPDKVLPFKIDRREAESKLKSFIEKKKFVPRSFYSEGQIEKMTGVYYPYWCYETEVEGDYEARGSKIHITRVRDEEITETSIYHVLRGGRLKFKNLTKNALNNEHRFLVENVQPYDLSGDDLKDFTMGFLSGFQAERRDQEKEVFSAQVKKEIGTYAQSALKAEAKGYDALSHENFRMQTVNEHWHYILLPVWVMTYRSMGGQTFYFAVNAQTGNAAGKLPIDYKKLIISSLLAGLGAGALGVILLFIIIMVM